MQVDRDGDCELRSEPSQERVLCQYECVHQLREGDGVQECVNNTDVVVYTLVMLLVMMSDTCVTTVEFTVTRKLTQSSEHWQHCFKLAFPGPTPAVAALYGAASQRYSHSVVGYEWQAHYRRGKGEKVSGRATDLCHAVTLPLPQQAVCVPLWWVSRLLPQPVYRQRSPSHTMEAHLQG